MNNLHGFCKQTIIDDCASSENILDDARNKTESVLEEKTGKQVSIVTHEAYSDKYTDNNAIDVY